MVNRRETRHGPNSVTRIGMYDCPGICKFLLEEINAAGLEERWELIDINPSEDLLRGKSLFSKMAKYADFVCKIMSVDAVMFVFVGGRSHQLARISHALGKKVIFYWVGTDVYDLVQGLRSRGFSRYQGADLSLADGEHLVEELMSVGVSAKNCIIVPRLPVELAKMPEEHAVLLSIPDARKEFYGYEFIKRLIADFPDVLFYVTRSSSPELYDYPNVVFKGELGVSDMNALFDEVSIHIRFPVHDGLSVMLMESLIKGKTNIYKFSFPRARQASDYGELASALSEVISGPPKQDVEGHKYAVEMFNQARAGRKLAEYLDSIWT